MNQENFIHIKLDYGEALKSKKDILFSEMDLLRMLKIIRKYHKLRNQELELKKEIHTKLRTTLTNLRKVESLLPKVKIPKILDKEEDYEVKTPKRKTSPQKEKQLVKYKDDIEFQLDEIKNKLKSLG